MAKGAMKAQTTRSLPLELRERLETAAGKSWTAIIDGVVADAIAGDPNARRLLVDLIPKPQYSPLPVSKPLQGLRLDTLENAVASQATVAQLTAAGEIGLAEGKAILELIQKVIDSKSALRLEELRDELEALRRDVRGGDKLVEGEIIPRWGNLAG